MRAWMVGTGVFFVLACGGGGSSHPAVTADAQWACTDCKLYDVNVVDGIAYLADNEAGFRVVDVRDPSAPQELALIPGKGISLHVEGDRAYFADWGRGLVIYDISDPSSPVELGVGKGAGAYYVQKKGNHVFMPGGVWDVSNESAPEKVAPLKGSGGNGASLVGDFLYEGASTKGFRIYDVSNPLAPEEVGAAEAAYAKDAEVYAGHAYVPAQNDKAVLVFDVSDPTQPKEVGRLEGFSKPTGVAVHGSTLYVADGGQGVQLFDLSSPSSPSKSKTVKLGTHRAYKVFAGDQGWFAADGKHLLLGTY